jgi:hypothetical protein
MAQAEGNFTEAKLNSTNMRKLVTPAVKQNKKASL